MSVQKRAFSAAVVSAFALGIGWPILRILIAPDPPEITAEAQQHLENVHILRDQFGVPHIFGATDADAAFGLAYAHAEDDWPLIQGVMAASRGQLGLIHPGKKALANDYYAAFIGVDDEIEATWRYTSPELVAVLEGYARGLNTYAFHHPDEADARLLPFDGKDIARGFIHKLPLMMKVDKVLKALSEGKNDVGDVTFPGSNAQAVARERSNDDTTRLNINAHQPWTGPVTFYEAHVRSAEGWNLSGALFPGAPFPLIGHNEHVGWALTVNKPDGVDVYGLDLDGDRYRYGKGWETLESERIWLPYETWWRTLWIPQTLRHSVHGPVFEGGETPVAVHHSAEGMGLMAAEQWFQMSKASSVDELKSAFQLHAIPMFNIVYASRDHIGFLYNGRIPDRPSGYDWTTVLPGDDPGALWRGVIPLSDHPAVDDPTSGFVQACNSAPWAATVGPDAPRPTPALSQAGIESVITNRTSRTLELLSGDQPISREAFLAMKWDPGLSADAPMRRKLLEPLRSATFTEPDLTELQRILLDWDGRFVEGSVGAGVATLVWRPLNLYGDDVLPEWEIGAALERSARHLREHFGRLAVPLDEISRLRRGDVDLPLLGGPDTLHCSYTEAAEDGRLVGHNGDGFVMHVEFTPTGVVSHSIHQFGSAPGRPESEHYADQAPLFVERQMKPVLRKEADIRAFLEADYIPGEPWKANTDDPAARLERARAVWE